MLRPENRNKDSPRLRRGSFFKEPTPDCVLDTGYSHRKLIDVCEVFRFMRPDRKNDLTDSVCSYSERPSSDQYCKVSQAGCCKTVTKTDLVNSERLWQTPLIPILFLNCNFQVFKVGHRAKSFWVVL